MVRGIGERFANYFLEDQGFFDSFEHLSVKDHALSLRRWPAIRSRRLWPVEPKTADLLAQNAGVSILSVSGGSTITMPMRADTPPFDNLDFRLAMKYLVDREQMRDVIFNGHASLANDHPVAPFDQFFNPAIAQRAFDPDRAKHHLEKAGYGGETIEIHASAAAFSGAVDSGVLFAENAKQAGVQPRGRAPTRRRILGGCLGYGALLLLLLERASDPGPDAHAGLHLRCGMG